MVHNFFHGTLLTPPPTPHRLQVATPPPPRHTGTVPRVVCPPPRSHGQSHRTPGASPGSVLGKGSALRGPGPLQSPEALRRAREGPAARQHHLCRLAIRRCGSCSIVRCASAIPVPAGRGGALQHVPETRRWRARAQVSPGGRSVRLPCPPPPPPPGPGAPGKHTIPLPTRQQRRVPDVRLPAASRTPHTQAQQCLPLASATAGLGAVGGRAGVVPGQPGFAEPSRVAQVRERRSGAQTTRGGLGPTQRNPPPPPQHPHSHPAASLTRRHRSKWHVLERACDRTSTLLSNTQKNRAKRCEGLCGSLGHFALEGGWKWRGDAVLRTAGGLD